MQFTRFFRALSATIAFVLLASLAVVSGPAVPAFAALGDTGALTLSKLVNSQAAVTVEPGETFTYDLVIGCDDNHCIDASLLDELPDEFAGFTLGDVLVSPGDPSGFDLQLTGGCVENAPITTGCGITVDFLQPLGDLAGVAQFGIIAGTTFRISYNLTAPLTLTPNWAYNGVSVPNIADLTASNAAAQQSTANVTVSVPVVVDASVSKSWSPSSQQYGPGSSSSVTVGIGNTSNVDASSLIIQDPAVAVDGATVLPNSNPFTRVDFDGLCGVTMPEGADLVQIDVYYEAPVGSWNWVTGTASATAALPAAVTDMARVGGLRLTYTSTSGDAIVADGDTGALCFTVTQRANHRTSAAALVTGGVVDNEAAATVLVTGEDSVTRTASASLTVAGLTVDVSAGKEISPDQVPASGEFSVNVSGKNDSNGTLSSLTLSEPGAGSFLSDDLIFDGFTGRTWPAGATGANFVWQLSTGALAGIPLTSASPVPANPALALGEYVTGFAVTYTGEIIAGTTAGWSFDVDTAADMVAELDVFDTYTNTVGISGSNAAGTNTASASDDVTIFYPEISIALDKTMSPDLTTPGGTAVVSLETATSSDSQYVRPTEIIVEDVWDGTAATSFWDAYRAQEIVFTDVPAGATLVVEYATGSPTPGPVVWLELTAPGGVTAMIDSLAVPSTALGLRFTYSNPSGFGQGTSVKPNIVFEAAGTLRDGSTPTDVSGDETSTRYFNVASAQGSGTAEALPVTSDVVVDDEQIDIITFDGTNPGPGAMLSSKDWVASNWASDVSALNSQSGATARTRLGWGVTTPGYSSAVISDAAAGSEATPATTVYQAFDLTRVMPISFAIDPLLAWDAVSSVELYMGGSWVTVTQPASGWMNGTGFVGHTLTAAQSADTTGVRITVVENTAVRTASTDPTRPAPGSGVASSAEERELRLQWQLRNTLRIPLSVTDIWVNQDIAYNLPGNGIIRNTFDLQATYGAVTYTRSDNDDISLIDTPPNVSTTKTASEPWVIVPHFGDVALNDYPTVDFVIEAWNTASARASYLRSADPVPCASAGACITPANDHSADIFSSQVYDASTNPFERFTLTGITFSTPANANIDPTVSQVAIWKRDAAGVLTVDQMSMTAAQALSVAQLQTVIGVSVVYQSTDPATTGGLIAQNAHLEMTLHTQLRSTLRSDGVTLVTSGVTVDNTTYAQSFDPVLTPSGLLSTPNASTAANVELRAAGLDVTASKSISPSMILKPNPGETITVSLGATSGSSTLGAETATIRDVDAGFWTEFRFTGVGTVTAPVGSDRVRVDVQLNGTPTWVAGVAGAVAVLPASVTDLSEITGIQFVFDRVDGEPFSATVPAADWNASAVFTAVLRDDAVFPGAVDNESTAIASHNGYPVVDDAASDNVVLSDGTAQIDVRKEAVTGNSTHIVEPGLDIPWTLEFTNTGTGLLGITSVTDNYGSDLQWDGGAPVYSTSAGGTLPTSGIVVTQPGPGLLEFTWPTDAEMQPDESFVITLKFSLLPGLTTAERATNEFIVNTVQTLTGCTNVSGNGQGLLAGLGSEQCGTSNYVQPLSGALLFAQKSVKGDVNSTLVDGAVNIDDATLPCTADAEGFYRAQCVARTAVGATDTWRLVATNSGTEGYSSLTVVDVLPSSGDKLLATGAARGSDFRPVLKDVAAPGSETVPSGTATVWEVSTDAAACVGTGPTSDWGTDPTCSTTTWVAGSSYSGNPEDVTAVRWTLDFAGTAGAVLAPGGTVDLRFDMVNTPLVSSDAISVEVPVGNQIAWNQFGVVATPTTGAVVRRAPVKAGVLAQPASLSVAKVVTGVAASLAPSSFEVTLACTVNDGAGGIATVDMAASRALSVPANGSSDVTGIPLGAECLVDAETVAGGASDIDLGAAVMLVDATIAGEITVTNTFSNAFLAATGSDGGLMQLLLIAALILVLIGLVAATASRRKQRES